MLLYLCQVVRQHLYLFCCRLSKFYFKLYIIAHIRYLLVAYVIFVLSFEWPLVYVSDMLIIFFCGVEYFTPHCAMILRCWRKCINFAWYERNLVFKIMDNKSILIKFSILLELFAHLDLTLCYGNARKADSLASISLSSITIQ